MRWPLALPRLNGFLPEGVSIDITSVDLTTIRDQLRISVADRLNETCVPVNPNDPVINAILARYAERPNGYFQRDALQIETYIWMLSLSVVQVLGEVVTGGVPAGSGC